MRAGHSAREALEVHARATDAHPPRMSPGSSARSCARLSMFWMRSSSSRNTKGLVT